MRVAEYKSPIRVVAGVLLRSRETHQRRGQEQARVMAEQRDRIQRLCRVIARQDQQLAELRWQRAQLRIENQQLRQRPVVLPEDPPLPRHQFGARMISLCVNLARVIGLRPSVACLEIVFEWLGVTVKLPDRTSVRLWMIRVGVAALEEPVEVAVSLLLNPSPRPSPHSHVLTESHVASGERGQRQLTADKSDAHTAAT